jgi:hypothetical protein
MSPASTFGVLGRLSQVSARVRRPSGEWNIRFASSLLVTKAKYRIRTYLDGIVEKILGAVRVLYGFGKDLLRLPLIGRSPSFVVVTGLATMA